jgi:hypothetical protein
MTEYGKAIAEFMIVGGGLSGASPEFTTYVDVRYWKEEAVTENHSRS